MELNNLYYRIKNEINILSSKINVPTELIPEINVSNEYASQFIEIDINNIVYLVIKERGNEIERLIPKDLNQLLFFVFKNITFTMAKNFEGKSNSPVILLCFCFNMLFQKSFQSSSH